MALVDINNNTGSFNDDVPLVEGSDLTDEQIADIICQEAIPVFNFSADENYFRMKMNVKCDARETEILRLNGIEIALTKIMKYETMVKKHGDDYGKIKGELMKSISLQLLQGNLKSFILSALRQK